MSKQLFMGDVYKSVLSGQTSAAMTLYVRVGGADTNDGLTVGTALLTIQAAVNLIPKSVGHAVSIDIGPGTFDGAYLSGFKRSGDSAAFSITGDLDAPTLASGTATGTATGGNTLLLTDAGQAWTVDNLIGHFLRVDGETRVIYDNDGTNIYVVGAFTLTTSGKTYEILEPKTIIDTEEAVEGDAGFLMKSNAIGVTLQNIEFDSIVVGVYNTDTEFGVDPTSCRFTSCTGSGLRVANAAQGVSVTHCAAMSCAIGFNIASNAHISSFEGCLSYGSTSYGIYLASLVGLSTLGSIAVISNGDHGLYVAQGAGEGFVCDLVTSTGNTGSGVRLESTNCLCVIGTDSILSSNSRYGIELDDNNTSASSEQTKLDITGNITIASNTLGGIIAKNRSMITMSNTDGTANGGYGLRLDGGSKAIITSATGITGTSGDTTVNTGNTIFTWAQYVDDGDILRNFETDSAIERRD